MLYVKLHIESFAVVPFLLGIEYLVSEKNMHTDPGDGECDYKVGFPRQCYIVV